MNNFYLCQKKNPNFYLLSLRFFFTATKYNSSFFSRSRREQGISPELRAAVAVPSHHYRPLCSYSKVYLLLLPLSAYKIKSPKLLIQNPNVLPFQIQKLTLYFASILS
jgi:hypothetical protein